MSPTPVVTGKGARSAEAEAEPALPGDAGAASQTGGKPAKRSSSSILLAVSNFGVFVFPFLRGVALAHLLSPKDFGLAISITTVASVIDIISDVGLYQFALRSTDPRSIPTLHAISLIRGAFIAATIVVCSPLCAYLFNAPGMAWAYGVVALAPLIRGFFHLDVKVAMRDFDFTKEAITELVGQSTWTVVSVAAALVLHDYRAMIIGLIVNAVATVAMTHVLARTRWRVAWDRVVVKEAGRFGRPLIPNGAATVLVNMGDRTLVGSYLGLDALASYSVLSTSAFLPRSALLRFLNALMTPQFVNAATPERTSRLLVTSAIVLSFIGGFFAFGYMAFGQPVIALVFGRHYAVAQGIVSLVAILSCVRFLAALTTPVGIAEGKTGLIFLNTATSGLGLGLGLLFVMHSPTLESMVAGMCVGELAALLFITGRLLRLHRASIAGVWSAVLPTLALVLGCAAVVWAAGDQALLPKIGISTGFMVLDFGVLGTVMSVQGITLRSVAGVLLPKRLQQSA